MEVYFFKKEGQNYWPHKTCVLLFADLINRIIAFYFNGTYNISWYIGQMKDAFGGRTTNVQWLCLYCERRIKEFLTSHPPITVSRLFIFILIHSVSDFVFTNKAKFNAGVLMETTQTGATSYMKWHWI